MLTIIGVKNKAVRVQNLPLRFLVITFCLAILSLTFSFQITEAQQKPLSLAQVLTGLQSKSGGFTLAQKNTFITTRVRQRGVTFRLTAEIEKELRQAGASPTLIRTIRANSPRVITTPSPNDPDTSTKPNASYKEIRVEPNVVKDGVRGINIVATFSVYNLRNVKSDIVYRFQRNGQMLKSTDPNYSTKTGTLSARRFLNPKYSATVYEDLAAFIPYKAFQLQPGVHNLKLDADVILRDGTQVKHLTLQDMRLVIPATTIIRKTGSATLGRLWVDYDVRQNGQLGMVVHVKMTVRNMKDRNAYIQVLFAKQDGTKLYARTSKYKSPTGQTAAYRIIKPIYASARFNDVSVFLPYREFNLPVGKHNISLHADVVYTDYSQLGHLGYKSFVYTRSR